MTINHNKGIAGISVVAVLALIASLTSLLVSSKSNSIPLTPIPGRALGAVGAITGMLAENYIPYVMYNQGYKSELDLTISGNTIMASTTFNATTTQSASGLSQVVSTGTFANATTTLFAVDNPFAATSTVDLAILKVTGAATTSITLNVGTSTVRRFAPAGLANRHATSSSLINQAPVYDDDLAYLVSGAVGNVTDGYTTATTTTSVTAAQRLVLGPNETIVGWIDDNGGFGSTAGATGGANTFAGTYLLRWITR